jgi:hypothetical protein
MLRVSTGIRYILIANDATAILMKVQGRFCAATHKNWLSFGRLLSVRSTSGGAIGVSGRRQSARGRPATFASGRDRASSRRSPAYSFGHSSDRSARQTAVPMRMMRIRRSVHPVSRPSPVNHARRGYNVAIALVCPLRKRFDERTAVLRA